MWCTWSLRMLHLQAATVRLCKLDAMPVLPPLPPTQATPRVGSSSSCPSVRLKPGNHPPTRHEEVLCRSQAAARLGANQTGGWSEWIGISLLSIDMEGARLGREPAIGPSLHLCYWPIQIETFFFIFYIACSCVGTNKTSVGQPWRLKLGAHFPATRGGRPYQPLWWRLPFLRVWLDSEKYSSDTFDLPTEWLNCLFLWTEFANNVKDASLFILL